MGITNCFSNFTGFLVPLATSILVGESKNPKDWANLFYLTAIINIIGGSVFCLLSNSEVQPWDPEYVYDRKKENELNGNDNETVEANKVDNVS